VSLPAIEVALDPGNDNLERGYTSQQVRENMLVLEFYQSVVPATHNAAGDVHVVCVSHLMYTH
jgi:hypothetical protein